MKKIIFLLLLWNLAVWFLKTVLLLVFFYIEAFIRAIIILPLQIIFYRKSTITDFIFFGEVLEMHLKKPIF